MIWWVLHVIVPVSLCNLLLLITFVGSIHDQRSAVHPGDGAGQEGAGLGGENHPDPEPRGKMILRPRSAVNPGSH